MFLKQIHVENFRLLMNHDVTLDEELTLFVGKNNAGKTIVEHAGKIILTVEFYGEKTSIALQ